MLLFEHNNIPAEFEVKKRCFVFCKCQIHRCYFLQKQHGSNLRIPLEYVSMLKLPPDYLIHKVESHYMQDFDRKSRLGNLTSVVAS